MEEAALTQSRRRRRVVKAQDAMERSGGRATVLDCAQCVHFERNQCGLDLPECNHTRGARTRAARNCVYFFWDVSR
jgi:hypothetical protein